MRFRYQIIHTKGLSDTQAILSSWGDSGWAVAELMSHNVLTHEYIWLLEQVVEEDIIYNMVLSAEEGEWRPLDG